MTLTQVKINNKIKVINVNKLKLFLQESDERKKKTKKRKEARKRKTDLQDLNFNDFSSYMPLMRARAKFINYKNQLNWH